MVAGCAQIFYLITYILKVHCNKNLFVIMSLSGLVVVLLMSLSWWRCCHAIYNGTNVDWKDYRFFVSLLWAQNSDVMCGGHIINSRIIMTQGSCLAYPDRYLDSLDIRLYDGTIIETAEYQNFYRTSPLLSQETARDGVNQTTRISDLGFIILKEPLDYERYGVCQALHLDVDQEETINRHFYSIGLGQDIASVNNVGPVQQRNNVQLSLMDGGTEIVNKTGCRHNLCFINPYQSLCWGDNGDPLLLKDSQGRDVVAGVYYYKFNRDQYTDACMGDVDTVMVFSKLYNEQIQKLKAMEGDDIPPCPWSSPNKKYTTSTTFILPKRLVTKSTKDDKNLTGGGCRAIRDSSPIAMVCIVLICMLRQKTLSVICTLIFLVGCCVIPADAIYNGQETSQTQFPFYVGIQLSTRPNFGIFCGGAILTKNLVVTADHCIEKGKDYSVCVGSSSYHMDYCIPIVDVYREREKFHNFETSSDNINDIAVVKLQTPFRHDPHICSVRLPHQHENDEMYRLINVSYNQHEKRDDVFQTMGFGFLDHHRTRATRLRTTHQLNGFTHFTKSQFKRKPLFDPDMCNKKMMICVARSDPQHFTDSCEGDSGGPLIWNRDDGGKVFVGIISIGSSYYNCGQGTDSFGIYVDVFHHKSFILKHIAQHSSDEDHLTHCPSLKFIPITTTTPVPPTTTVVPSFLPSSQRDTSRKISIWVCLALNQ